MSPLAMPGHIAVVSRINTQGIGTTQMLDSNNNNCCRIIEKAARDEPNKTAFEIILEEWGTMSWKRRLPTMGVLLEYLIDIEAIRAASYLSLDVLGGKMAINPIV